MQKPQAETTMPCDCDDICEACLRSIPPGPPIPPPQCNECGRFMRVEPGVAWKRTYSGGALPGPDREIYRCLRCTTALGGFIPQAGIKPEYSCGILKQ